MSQSTHASKNIFDRKDNLTSSENNDALIVDGDYKEIINTIKLMIIILLLTIKKL